MQLLRGSGYLTVRCLIFALLVGKGLNSQPENSAAQENKYDRDLIKFADQFDYEKYLADKYNTSPNHTKKKLVTRGLLDNIFGSPELKFLEKLTVEAYRKKKNLGSNEEIDPYEKDFLSTLQEQVKYFTQKSTSPPDPTEERLRTRGLLDGIFGSPELKALEKPVEEAYRKKKNLGVNEGINPLDKDFLDTLREHAKTPPKNEPEKTRPSSGGWFSWFPRFLSPSLKPEEKSPPKPEAAKRGITGGIWFSFKLRGGKSNVGSDQPEQRLAARGFLDGIWGTSAPKAPEKLAEGAGTEKELALEGEVDPLSDEYYDAPEDQNEAVPPAEPEEPEKPPSSGGWFSGWGSPASKPQEKTPAKPSAGGGWLNPLGSPKPSIPAPEIKPKDNSGGGWFWSSPSTSDASSGKSPEPASKVDASVGLFGGWFGGGSEKPSDGKKSKQHGPFRSLVKSVEHTIVPFKPIRRALKSIPGVRPTRQTMKSTLDAVDSVADTEYVRNIRSAAAESRKRVGLKAVGLADSVWELGTGATDTTLNLVDTLQKEGARSLDAVGVACPPTRSAVDFVKSKMGEGVGFLQSENDRIRKRGKGVLSKISGGAVGGPEVATATQSTGGEGSWFGW